MTPEEFAARLDASDAPEFEDSIGVIEAHFDYTPCAFNNGEQANKAGENTGSCKILAFGALMQLTEEQTLRCFGRFYRDVLATPEGSDHGNIRNFMLFGWQGVSFEGTALRRR